ncbi:MAG: hypothetical protein CL607_08720 [Anaerolineaceae bacterium]|nr:hypothetical protein [Anaerolineaceae bacterium]
MKLLVIDDDNGFVYMVNSIFSEHTVDQAMTVPAAEQYLAENVPDVVFVDFLLPGNSDGLALIQLLKEDSRFENTFIVGLTASSTADSRVKAMMGYCDLFYSKPFSLLTVSQELQARGVLDSSITV